MTASSCSSAMKPSTSVVSHTRTYRASRARSSLVVAANLGGLAGSRSSSVERASCRALLTAAADESSSLALSRADQMRALEVLRHHRLLERFLHDFLDYSWDEVHDEAERLEHYISEKLEDRIAAKLGDPDTDPHGHLIPVRDGVLPAREEVPLSNWACGVPAVISSVSDRDPAALREMTRFGLKPGVAITVDAGTRNASLLVRIGDHVDRVRLSQVLASGISVIPDPNARIRSDSGSSTD